MGRLDAGEFSREFWEEVGHIFAILQLQVSLLSLVDVLVDHLAVCKNGRRVAR